MRKFLSIITFIVYSFTAYGQNISGTITDSNNNEELIGVNIILSNGTGTASDVFGKYSLKAAVGIQKVTFRYIGYQDIVKEVTLAKGEEKMNFEGMAKLRMAAFEGEDADSARVWAANLGELKRHCFYYLHMLNIDLSVFRHLYNF